MATVLNLVSRADTAVDSNIGITGSESGPTGGGLALIAVVDGADVTGSPAWESTVLFGVGASDSSTTRARIEMQRDGSGNVRCTISAPDDSEGQAGGYVAISGLSSSETYIFYGNLTPEGSSGHIAAIYAWNSGSPTLVTGSDASGGYGMTPGSHGGYVTLNQKSYSTAQDWPKFGECKIHSAFISAVADRCKLPESGDTGILHGYTAEDGSGGTLTDVIGSADITIDGTITTNYTWISGGIWAASTPTFDGDAALDLPALTVAATGTVALPAIVGAAALVIPALAVAATGAVTSPAFEGDAALNLPAVTIAATGTVVNPGFNADAALDLAAVTIEAAGTVTPPVFTGDSDNELPALTIAATGVFSPLPPATRSIQVHTRAARERVELVRSIRYTQSVWAGVIDLASGTLASDLPALTVAATGTVVLPTGTGTAALTLPALTVAASGTVSLPVRTATADLTLPALTAVATGTVVDPPSVSGDSANVLPALGIAATGSVAAPSAIVGTLVKDLPALTVAAAGVVFEPLQGDAPLDLPALTVSATGTRTLPEITGTAALVLPMLTVTTTETVVTIRILSATMRGASITSAELK